MLLLKELKNDLDEICIETKKIIYQNSDSQLFLNNDIKLHINPVFSNLQIKNGGPIHCDFSIFPVAFF